LILAVVVGCEGTESMARRTRRAAREGIIAAAWGRIRVAADARTVFSIETPSHTCSSRVGRGTINTPAGQAVPGFLAGIIQRLLPV
jgi:hypothetical protein